MMIFKATELTEIPKDVDGKEESKCMTWGQPTLRGPVEDSKKSQYRETKRVWN